MAWIAASASACCEKVTNPKPRERPVPGSVMTMQSITCPNLDNRARERVSLRNGGGERVQARVEAYCEKASRSESLLVPLTKCQSPIHQLSSSISFIHTRAGI